MVVTFETLGIVQQMRRGIPNSSSPETFGGLRCGDVVEFPKPSAGSRLARIRASSHPPGNELLARNVVPHQPQAFAQVIKDMS
jgi:hypothetical protein